jgi:hypothetical protein
MARGGIRLAGLPVLALAVLLAGGLARAEEPLRLDDPTLDTITAGAAKGVKAAGIVAQVVLPGSGKGLADLALELARQKPTVIPPTGSTGNGKRTVSRSGKKTFKADRVTKGHREILVVSGSAGG